jgi:hypothetical protein
MNTDEILPPGYQPPAIYSTENFVRPPILYRKEMKCIKCGQPYTLHTPYEKCNETIRDLCTDCIWKLQNDDRWS